MISLISFITTSSSHFDFAGQIAAIYIAEAVKNPKSAIHTLRLAHNDLGEQGGSHVAKSLIGNVRITDLDLSSNYLTFETAVYVADAARGLQHRVC